MTGFDSLIGTLDFVAREPRMPLWLFDHGGFHGKIRMAARHGKQRHQTFAVDPDQFVVCGWVTSLPTTAAAPTRKNPKMTYGLKRTVVLLPLMAPILLGACVSQATYDALAAQNQQLQQQVANDQAHIVRLQGAIKYTVNSDLLFPSGGWQMSADGKDIIAKMAKTLAANQQDKLVVNGYTDNAAIGPVLKQQGITSNDILSKKRAETVMQYMISQGVKPDLVTAVGHGEQDPVGSNSTAAGRAQNRRVEVTIAGKG